MSSPKNSFNILKLHIKLVLLVGFFWLNNTLNYIEVRWPWLSLSSRVLFTLNISFHYLETVLSFIRWTLGGSLNYTNYNNSTKHCPEFHSLLPAFLPIYCFLGIMKLVVLPYMNYAVGTSYTVHYTKAIKWCWWKFSLCPNYEDKYTVIDLYVFKDTLVLFVLFIILINDESYNKITVYVPIFYIV